MARTSVNTRNKSNRERGATAVEYAVLLVFIILVSMATIYILQNQLAGTEDQGYANGFFSRIAQQIGGFGFMD